MSRIDLNSMPPSPLQTEPTQMNFPDLCCPRCGDRDHIDILAQLWVRVTPGGTDTAGNRDQLYTPESAATCGACNFDGTVAKFQTCGTEAIVKLQHATAIPLAMAPWWIRGIHSFDAIEVHPCCVVGSNEDRDFIETCEPEAAHFWSVYGHRRTGGVLCFEDFPTKSPPRLLPTGFAGPIRILRNDDPFIRNHIPSRTRRQAKPVRVSRSRRSTMAAQMPPFLAVTAHS